MPLLLHADNYTVGWWIAVLKSAAYSHPLMNGIFIRACVREIFL